MADRSVTAILRNFLLCGALLLAHGGALGAGADDGLAAQRGQYRAAMAALRAGDARPFARVRGALTDYPLYPYLELADLRGRLGSLPTTEVDAFLERHGRQLPAARLRAAWLQTLASRERWTDFLRYYVEDPANTERRCHRAWALLQTGSRELADQETATIWLSPRSLPKACDRLFQSWSARGNPSPALAWQRFHAAIGAGQPGLARYLIRLMDATQASDAELFLQVVNKPAIVKAPSRFDAANPRHSQVIEAGLVRLAGSDPQGARIAFEHYARSGQLGDDALRNVAPRIASVLAAVSADRALQWISGLEPRARNDAISEDAVRYALRGDGWTPVLAAIDLLPAHLAGSERWAYWTTRSAEAANRGAESSRERYASLGATRSYYGFLAADRIGQRYAMQHEPLPTGDDVLGAARSNPGVRRARELHLLGESLESRREWLHTIGIMAPEERVAAATIAAQWGWHQLTISTLIAAGEWNALELRFPRVYEEDFGRAARQQHIDDTWLYAIARQESALNATVKSPAGALGLMQVMPATAQLTARKAGLKYAGSADLLKPGTNVVIGSRYMRMMLDEFQQNRILAAAAYNAGPGRVRQWLRRLPAEVDHDRFVETIPFRETRQYVQNVLSFALIYAYLQGREAALVQPREQIIHNPYAAVPAR